MKLRNSKTQYQVQMSDGEWIKIKYNVMDSNTPNQFYIAIPQGFSYRGVGKTKEKAWKNLQTKMGPGLADKFVP